MKIIPKAENILRRNRMRDVLCGLRNAAGMALAQKKGLDHLE
jgi:hypothetical protein